jgi:pyruvate kinase
VANAILDGTDAIMLSGETASGNYPVESVEMMKKIADSVESSHFCSRNKFPRKMIEEEQNTQAMAIGMSIADMTKKMNIKAVAALTGSGFTPIFLAEGKLSAPIFAACPNKKVRRALKLYRGVYTLDLDFEPKIDTETLKTLNEFLIKEIGLSNGDTIILTGCVPNLLVGGTNFIKIHKIEG